MFRTMHGAASGATSGARKPRGSRSSGLAAGAAVLGLLVASALGAASPAGAATAPANKATTSNCRTTTSLGRVQGLPQGGVCSYLGLPYAAPPTGALRFKPPAPVAPWHGTLQATATKPGCPQDLSVIDQGVEDCLYTNVWQPRGGGSHKPVMVFIHGGADELGSAGESVFNGAELAARGDAVVVNMDYRLGILGWTELGGLDPKYAGSGNNGLRDQIAALTWVQKHIASFGGDASDVTVFGESEGAISIDALLAGDHPERLFHRAILESGPGYLVHTQEYAKAAATHILAAGNVTGMAQLDAMSTTQVLQLQEKAQDGIAGLADAIFFGPSIDGRLIPGPVVDRIAAGSARNVEIMAGTNENETDYWALFEPQVLDLPLSGYRSFPAELADRKQQMYDTYAADRPGLSEGRVVNAMITDQTQRVPTLRLAEAQSRWRPTYVYQFNWHVPYVAGLPAAQNLGAMHTLELPFVFGNLDLGAVPRGAATLAAQRPQLTSLSDDMMDSWTAFARCGAPGWPSYTPAARATRIWDLKPSVQNAPQERERELWNDYSFPAWSFQSWGRSPVN
ncbi:carboxylesterase/lipase family protein [Kitasatospora kifunensis]|uniref:Para-nitrobenzyl esterase n=1 Tax=Kitasatospora kifunensis TaxID=58351 RepID=A0A7W7QZJ9_KITKI|nr:carboxylesterase family protein [Kitasatospora kifunensis]MBB4922731.1 para-nitrobenzyl esterase [Kitasatospora kifunensis]